MHQTKGAFSDAVRSGAYQHFLGFLQLFCHRKVCEVALQCLNFRHPCSQASLLCSETLLHVLRQTEAAPADPLWSETWCSPTSFMYVQVPMDEAFSFVDPVPLATASVAQVHAAVLRGSNKDVVIKVSFVCAHGEHQESGMFQSWCSPNKRNIYRGLLSWLASTKSCVERCLIRSIYPLECDA